MQFDKIMSGNSLFDPDVSGAGHQPLGFDEWMAIYGRYRVLGSQCTVNTINNSTTANGNVTSTLVPTISAGAIPNDENAEELPDATEDNAGLVTGSAEDRLVRSMQTTTMVGVPNIRYSPDYSGNVGSSPAQQWYWRIFHASVDASTMNCFVNVTIIYTCEFYQKKLLLQS